MFRSSVLAFVLVVTNLSLPNNAYAWDQYGHVTICEMAYRFFTDETQAKVNELLQSHPDRERFQFNQRFNNACLFADDRPQVGRTRHFINVPRDTAAIISDGCPPGPKCTFDGIRDDLGTLKDTSQSDADRALALIYLGHWVGDLHQPLHVSFKDDSGGNKILKERGGICSAGNLHSMWDKCILERGVYNLNAIERRLGWRKFTRSYRYADVLIQNMKSNEADFGEWIEIDYGEWANESFQIAVKPEVKYCVEIDNNCQYDTDTLTFVKDESDEDEGQKRIVLDRAYVEEFAPTVEDRMSKAAVRLAHLINIALDDNYDENSLPEYPGE